MIPDRQTVYLDESDDAVSICDRLDWVNAERILLVLPEQSSLFEENLDLMRIRRHADRLNLEIGLITVDTHLRRNADALGFPVFATVKLGERSTQRVWRRARRAKFKAYQGKARSQIDARDRHEVYRRQSARPAWQQWVARYIGITLFFITLAILFIGMTYSIPNATVTLKPMVQPVRATKQVVADPQLDSVNFSGASVPARLMIVTTSWQATVDTTGAIEIPDAPSRGSVVFANKIEEPVLVPAGTRITTSAGQRIIFQTLREVEVPGVLGGTAEVDIVAIEPGPQNNVAIDQINRIEGSLAIQLEVRNLEPTTGGGVRISKAVTEADWERLRSQVLQFIQALALGDMEAQLTEREFLAHDSLRIVEIYQETFSHFVGEQTDRLTLEIRAEVHGTAIDETQATDLIYQELIQNIQPGFELVPESLDFSSGDVIGVDSQGRVSFIMIGEGQSAAQLALSEPLDQISGQTPELALAYLDEQLPLREYPSVEIWPIWFDRIPYLPIRIQTDIHTGE